MFQDKLKSNHANEGHSSVVAEQIDRAPIIVSTNNQTSSATSTKSKDMCKNNRTVIVRAGTVSVCISQLHFNIFRLSQYF